MEKADNGRKTGLAPLVCDRPQVLILGSLPGDRSLELQEYYGHPQNRFWKVIAGTHGLPCPPGYPEKKRMLADCRIALWDVYHAASRPGSMDADIRKGEFNDIAGLLDRFPEIRTLALNGSAAAAGFDRYVSRLGYGSRALPAERSRNADMPSVSSVSISGHQLRIFRMPSTSPANARWTLDRLTEAWNAAFSIIEDSASH